MVGVTEYMSNLFPQGIVRLFELITVFGEQYAVIAFIGLFYWCIDKKKGQFIALCAVTSAALNNFFKNIFRVPRPFAVSDKVRVTRADTATGHSFPSGHTQNAATASFSAAHGSKKAAPYVTAAVYVILVGISRLVLGAHYITDVIGAILLAGVSIALVSAVESLSENDRKRLFILCVPPLLSIISIFIEGAQQKDALTSGGIALGVIIGIIIEREYIDFCTSGSFLKRAARFVLGLIVVLAVMQLLKLILPDNAVCRVIRYFFVGITATAALPFIFKKINL